MCNHHTTLTNNLFVAVCVAMLATLTDVITSASRANDSDVINIGVILPFDNSQLWSIPKVEPGIDYAVHAIEVSDNLLEGKRLKVIVRDSKCSDIFAPLAAIDMYWRREAHVFIGPACDYAVAPIARYAPHWNIPLITGGAMVTDFTDKSQYFLTRISGSYDQVGRVVAAIFERFGWVVPGLLFHDNDGPRRARLGRSNCHFSISGVHVALQGPFKKAGHEKIWYKHFDENDPDESARDYEAILNKIAQNARSRILICYVIMYIRVFHHLLYLHTYIHYIHLHTYMIHTYIHTCIHTYIHTYIYACMHACVHACVYACIHACILTYTHTHTYAHTHSYTYPHLIIYINYLCSYKFYLTILSVIIINLNFFYW